MRRPALVILVGGLVVLTGCAGMAELGNAGSVGDAPAVDDIAEDEVPDAAGNDAVQTTETRAELELHHIDVGQGDATLIITPAGETVLIDTGDWRDDGEAVIAYLEAHDINRIDHLVASHGHADHIGGHAAIIEWAETEGDGIGAAYDSGVPHDTATYEGYLDAIEEYEVELFLVEEGDELPLRDGNVTALVVNPPAGDSSDDLHVNSVSIVFEYGEFRYVTTGDAEANTEERMVDEWADELAADIYQAGHHGSSSSSSARLMDAASPDIAIISSAYDSQYGHPHDEVLEAFADRDIETYWTGVHGDIVVTTNGTDIWIQTETEFSTDPADLLEEKPADDDEQEAVSAGPIQAPAALIAG